MAKKNEPQLPLGETIIEKSMDTVMHESMLPYAEYVILERALPRVEDGLKPVQRRILYTMLELGTTPDKPHRKSARIVGDCLGKYHPHGDTSVYDAMVRMAQPFNMQMPLVDGHGNFGSVDGDSAAAMRYTEARMAPIALEMLRDLDKDTVPFALNFDDTLKEPELLPGRFPNLLVNGASGIAVGLATNIPPHNLREAIDAVLLQMEQPEVSLDALMQVMPCPDFPTGGYLLDSPEIRAAYETGRGKLTMRAKVHMEEGRAGRKLIVVTEFPYQVNKARALEDILKVSQEKKTLFAGIADIRDESDRSGTRAVIEVKKDADADKILAYLYKYSDLQTTFGVNMVAIAGGKPLQMGLKEIIAHYIRHQEEVVSRRTRFDLEAAQRREHILEGLMVAIANIDAVIALIRASKTPKAARDGLMERFGLKKLRGVIKKELEEIRDAYGVPRRTQLMQEDAGAVLPEEEAHVSEEALVVLLPGARVRRMPPKAYNPEQGAGENPLALIQTATDRRLRFFTNLGACCFLPVEEIPETRLNGKPANLNALIAFEKDEQVVACLEEGECEGQLYFYTVQGNVKCTQGSEYNARTRRVAAISLKEGDRLLGVEPAREDSILLITSQGMSIRFARDTVPEMGRVAAGVKGIRLEAGDQVVFAQQVGEDGEVLTISDRGYAKRSFVFDHELQGRNGKGLKAFDFKKNGSNGTAIAAALYVREPYNFTVEQKHGAVTLCNTEEVRIDNRAGRGDLLVMALLDDVVIGAHRQR